MQWSAPASRATLALSSDEMVVMTVAPRALANWMTYWLTEPAPPETNRVLALCATASSTALIGRHRRYAEAGARLETHVAGQRHGLGGGQHDEFRGGAERALQLAVPQPHPLADARGRHAGADRLDLAGAIAVRDHAREKQLAQPAAFHVGRVDAGSAHTHAHLAGARRGGFDLADAQHLARGSHGFVECSTHGSTPSLGVRPSGSDTHLRHARRPNAWCR